MHWQTQRKLGKGLLIAFVAVVALLWLITPVRTLITEKLLGNIVLSGENGFDERFGGFTELVKDRGGSQPVPLQPDAPLRLPQYRGVAWLRMQDAKAWTLQVMSLSDERAVGNFLSARNDRDQFVYFKLPELPDPALPDGPVNMRYVIAYGGFATREEAVEVAAALTGLPGAAMPRTWGSYQAIYAAMPEPRPVPVVTPPAEPPAGTSVLPDPGRPAEPAVAAPPLTSVSADARAGTGQLADGAPAL